MATKYETLAQSFAALIEQGTLRAGDRLPSVREVVATRGLSPSTVFEAYYLLEARGLVSARPRSGYFVNARPERREEPQAMRPTAGQQAVAINDVVMAVLDTVRDRRVVPLGSAFPDPALFPLERLARGMGTAMRRLDPSQLLENLTPGNPDLRHQIALRDLAQGVPSAVDEIVITSGAMEALALSLQAVTQPGDVVAIESPAFYGCLQLLERLRLRAVEVATHPRLGVQLDSLEQVLQHHPVKACWFMPTFQNPMGALMPVERKQALVALLARHRVPLIEDDVYTYVFRPNTAGTSAQLLKDPLWYVAKYGGYNKEDDDTSTGVGPTRQSEWDALPVTSTKVGDGVPDNYFLVQNPLNLKTQLRRALENIANNSASGGNIIANSTRLDEESYVFQATFNNSRWSGDLLAYRASSSGVSQTADWNAASGLPKNRGSARNIFYWSDASGANKGKAFLWSNLSTAEKALLDANATTAQRVLDYVRGSDAWEFSKGGTFRDRTATTVLGDIAHSSPAYSKDSTAVFVGSNDGMLHAFSTQPLSATNPTPPGTELFAYIPSVILPRLRTLTAVGYNVNHEYFVDGDVAVSSQVGSPARNYLVASLGRGGKGLFGLDVTTPANFSANDVKWEYFPTDAADPHLGKMLGRPVIAKVTVGNQAVDVVIVGNGYNSVNESAALYVFNLATGELIKRLVVPTTSLTTAGGNGLAMPGVFDANNDGRVDVAYAGDLYGQVWRFDLSSSNTDDWVAPTAPIFVARDGSGNTQPITSPMTVAINSVSVDPNFNKRFVFFGTGSYFQTGDPANTRRQTLYSIIDDPATPLGNRSTLRQRTLSSQIAFSALRDPSEPEGPNNPRISRTVRTVSAQTGPSDMSGMLGCYVDLPETGERTVTKANVFRLAEPTLIWSSIIPESVDQCVPGGRGYVNAVNPFTCARLAKPFFDLNDSGSFNDDTLSNGAYASSVQTTGGLPGEAIIVGNRLVAGQTGAPPFNIRINTGATPLRGRLSWREIVRD